MDGVPNITPPERMRAHAGNRPVLVAVDIQIQNVPNKIVEYVKITPETIAQIEALRGRGIIGFEYDGTQTMGVILNQ